MIYALYDYVHAYTARPTVVAMDIFLLLMGIGVLVGVMALKRKIDDLNVAIQQLQNKITKG